MKVSPAHSPDYANAQATLPPSAKRMDVCENPRRQRKHFLCRHQRMIPEHSSKPFLVFYSAARYKKRTCPPGGRQGGDCAAFVSFPWRHGPADLGRRPALWVTIPESWGGNHKSHLFRPPASSHGIPDSRLVSGDLLGWLR